MNLDAPSSYTTGTAGSVSLSAGNILNNNAVQTFNTGGGTVTYTASTTLNMEATNSYGDAANVYLNGLTVNIDASQSASNTINISAQNLNVASGQTLSANNLNVNAYSLALVLTDNGNITATSSLSVASKLAPGTGDSLTLQGSPQQALSVTGDGGALTVWSDGDLDIDSSYTFSASGSGSSITFVAGNLNLDTASTFSTGANGTVSLSAATINNNTVQTFTTGSGSSVQLIANNVLNMEATNNYGTVDTVELYGTTINIDASHPGQYGECFGSDFKCRFRTNLVGK